MKNVKYYARLFWENSPCQLLNRVKNKITKKSLQSAIFNTYYTDIINLLYEFISEKYPDQTMGKEDFKSLILKYHNSAIVSQANTYCADLWELFKPDYKNKFEEYYKWHELLLFMRFSQYAMNKEDIEDNYVKAYYLAIDKFNKLRVLEIGGGIPHGFIHSILYKKKDFCSELTFIDIDVLHTHFVEWFCQKYSIPCKILIAKAAKSSCIPHTSTYDFVFAKDVFEHVENPELLLKKIYSTASDKCLLVLDLEDKGKVVYQHISPNLAHFKKNLDNEGFKQIDQVGLLSFWTRKL